MILNKDLEGKTYDPQEYTITADESRKYAEGYNEDLPLFLDEARDGGIIAPPMFAVKYTGASLMQAFFDTDLNLNFGRMLHGEQDMEFLLPVKPGDVITGRSRIEEIVERGSGEFFSVRVEAKNQDGDAVFNALSGFFVRGEKKAGDKRPPTEESRPETAFSHVMNVREDQTYIYAEGSGDHNPIHVDPDFAKGMGLPGIILQGLCTMAFSFKAVQDEAAGRDPLRVKRLKVRFAKPVLPKDRLTIDGWVIEKGDGMTKYGLETTNQDGVVMIKNAYAIVAD